MITADTITDEQIRELQRETGLEVCAIALGHNPYPHPRSTMLALRMQLDARARCAEILNARVEACKHEWSVDEQGTKRCIGCGEPG